MMKRRELREHIFELLFRIEFNSSEEMPEQMQLFFDGLDELGEQDQSYMEEKYRRIVEKLPELDRRIEETAKSWRISRMGKVDLTILRLAVYEMEFDDDVPVGVAINEAVELSKKFGGDDSPAFVNGISSSNQGVFTLRSTSFSRCPVAPSTIYPTQSINRILTGIFPPTLISTASFGTNLGSVVIIVLPAADWGSSSVARSLSWTSSILGSTKRSIKRLINVDFPVRTGPTTPM